MIAANGICPACVPWTMSPLAQAATFETGDWAAGIFVAFFAGLLASFIARPQGAGCFGFGCLGNLLVGAVGAGVGRFLVGLFYRGDVGLLPAFAVSFAGSLLVLYVGQGIDRLLRRGRPPEPDGDAPPPRVIEGTAREARREIDEDASRHA